MKALRGIFSVLALIAANLYPLAGVLFWGWDAATVLLLYWVENLILGFYTVLKMAALTKETVDAPLPAGGSPLAIQSGERVREIDPQSKRDIIRSFCSVYGMFCLFHGLVVVLLIAGSHGGFVRDIAMRHPDSPIFLSVIGQLLIPSLCLFASHGVSFVENFLVEGERRRATLANIPYQPCVRIMVMQFGVLFGFGLANMAGGISNVIALLVVLKIIADLALHLW